MKNFVKLLDMDGHDFLFYNKYFHILLSKDIIKLSMEYIMDQQIGR